jgi:hypothetical protein
MRPESDVMPRGEDAATAVDRLNSLVARAEGGDGNARDALFTTLYDELHRLARTHLHRSHGHVTLGATTLLHEAYLDMSQRQGLTFPNRLRFLSYASRARRWSSS